MDKLNLASFCKKHLLKQGLWRTLCLSLLYTIVRLLVVPLLVILHLVVLLLGYPTTCCLTLWSPGCFNPTISFVSLLIPFRFAINIVLFFYKITKQQISLEANLAMRFIRDLRGLLHKIRMSQQRQPKRVSICTFWPEVTPDWNVSFQTGSQIVHTVRNMHLNVNAHLNLMKYWLRSWWLLSEI